MIVLKNLFCYADKYLQKSSWKDLALLKFCLFSIGILAGMQVPEKHKKRVGLLAFFVFLVSYVPLMKKFVGVVTEKSES